MNFDFDRQTKHVLSHPSNAFPSCKDPTVDIWSWFGACGWLQSRITLYHYFFKYQWTVPSLVSVQLLTCGFQGQTTVSNFLLNKKKIEMGPPRDWNVSVSTDPSTLWALPLPSNLWNLRLHLMTRVNFRCGESGVPPPLGFCRVFTPASFKIFHFAQNKKNFFWVSQGAFWMLFIYLSLCCKSCHKVSPIAPYPNLHIYILFYETFYAIVRL